MAGRVLEHAGPFPILVRLELFENTRPTVARAGERRVDVWYADFDHVRGDAFARRNPIATGVGDDDGTVRPDPHLGAVRVADPDPLLEALRRLGAEPGEAAYVGDSPFDVRAAKAAGMFMVGVTWGRIHERDALEGADALVDTTEELLGVL